MTTRTLSSGLMMCAAAVLTALAAVAQDVPAPQQPSAAPTQDAPVVQPPPAAKEGAGLELSVPSLTVAHPSEGGEAVLGFPNTESTDGLEDVINRVVESSPGVQVAKAQLREAEAKLRQAQMEAVQKATEVYQNLLSAEHALNVSKKTLARVQEAAKAGVATEATLLQSEQQLAEAQAQVVRYKTELQTLAGANTPDTLSSALPSGIEQEPLVQKLRPGYDSANAALKNTLDIPISVEFEKGALAEVKNYLVEYAGLNMVIDSELADESMFVSVRLEEAPLKNTLLAIADSLNNVCFVLRDYGVFVTTRERAQRIDAPCIPSDIPLYVPAGENLPVPRPQPSAAMPKEAPPQGATPEPVVRCSHNPGPALWSGVVLTGRLVRNPGQCRGEGAVVICKPWAIYCAGVANGDAWSRETRHRGSRAILR